MSKRRVLFATLLAVLLLFAVTGCKKQPQEPEVIPEPTTEREPAVQPSETDRDSDTVEVPPDRWEQEQPTVDDLENRTIAEWNAQGVLQTVYFGFDRDDLNDEGRRIVKDNSAWLQRHPDFNVVVEGHCDERGTIEYNLALGERRARAVRDYMVNLGLQDGRVRIVTFGEERPVDSQSNEGAWSQNRRGAFVLE